MLRLLSFLLCVFLCVLRYGGVLSPGVIVAAGELLCDNNIFRGNVAMPLTVGNMAGNEYFCRMKLTHLLPLAILTLGACSTQSQEEGVSADDTDFDPVTLASSQVSTPDLRHYELVGPVKSSRRVTYYDLLDVDGKLEPDTASANMTEAVAYFDANGGYVTKKDERLRRDEQGRITRWEDRHPNYRTIHPGFLRDTLAYEFPQPHVMRVHGKGLLSVVVTDRFGNIIGQQSHSADPKYDTSATNIYRRYDSHGNWTERLTVWTTSTRGDSIPSIRYSIDRRKIVYY